jgi:ABC-2 type transport system ATP-binding protein
MQEVQAICDRAIIINNGQKVADHTIKDLLNLSGQQVLEVEFEQEINAAVFKQLDLPHQLTVANANLLHFEFDTTEDMRPVLMKFIAEQNLPLIGIKKRESSMEDVFNTLTKSV